MIDWNPLHTHAAERHTRVFAALLHLYPARFRQAYGAEMLILFRDCLRDARGERGQGVPRLWLSTFTDLSYSAPRAHFEEWTTMQASYTTSSRLGAIVAIATALGFMVLTTGVGAGNLATPGNAVTTLLFILFSSAWFGMLYSLHLRIKAVRPLTESRASLAVAGIATVLMLIATALYATGSESAGDWAAFGIFGGALALGLLGISAARSPDLGPLRFAPSLALVAVVSFGIAGAVVWNDFLVFTGLICTVLSLIGTGVLLWTKSN